MNKNSDRWEEVMGDICDVCQYRHCACECTGEDFAVCAICDGTTCDANPTKEPMWEPGQKSTDDPAIIVCCENCEDGARARGYIYGCWLEEFEEWGAR